MPAKIIGQNHNVIPYEVNGRKRYVVEDVQITTNREIVNEAVSKVGRMWEDVYNHIDSWLDGSGRQLADDTALCNCIENMTY